MSGASVQKKIKGARQALTDMYKKVVGRFHERQDIEGGSQNIQLAGLKKYSPPITQPNNPTQKSRLSKVGLYSRSK